MVAAADHNFRHAVPPDLEERLSGDPALAAMWSQLTDLARNEWICWVTSAKQAKTRATRLARLGEEVTAGNKRPCCWPGCPHRRESARKWVDG